MIIVGKAEVEKYKREKYNDVIKILYDNFKKYFDNGDIIITGSISYNSLNIINYKHPKDLDIAIISGDYGDKILYELINFYKELGYEVIIRDWDELRAVVKLQDGMLIDIFRNDFNNKLNSIDIKILNDITCKYYGHDWIINILIDKYYWFKKNKPENIVQINKFKKLIFEIYDSTNSLLLDDTKNKISLL